MRTDFYKNKVYWLVLWIALFVFLQYNNEYHFYLIEQNQLFQWSMAYWLEGWNIPGAVSTWISEFLVQFFLLPYGGAGISAVLLTGVGIGTSLVMKQILSDNRGIFISLLPAVFLLFTHFDFNYLVSGTVAYLFLLIFLNGVIRIKGFRWRWFAALIGTALLFYIAGPVSMLFAGIITLYELGNRTPRGYLMLLVNAEDFFYNYYTIPEMSVFNGSFLKLREVHLTYNFPRAMLEKTKYIKGARVSLIGSNLALLWVHKSNIAHIDPESTMTYGDDPESTRKGYNSGAGFESNSYPPSRSIGIKLGVTF